MDYIIYNIAELPAELAELTELPPEEQSQAARRGTRYTLVRTLLRRELSRRTGQAPQDIRLTYSEHGKPLYPEQPFNLSHSGECLCLAFHHREIGVDVERVRPRRFEPLASRFMCAEQFSAFVHRGCRKEEFYACWCATEALVKHAGDTMWHAPDYPFMYHHGHIRCLFSGAPVVELFTPMPGYQGALAYHPS